MSIDGDGLGQADPAPVATLSCGLGEIKGTLQGHAQRVSFPCSKKTEVDMLLLAEHGNARGSLLGYLE